MGQLAVAAHDSRGGRWQWLAVATAATFFAACSPCAALRESYARTLRDELVWVGADALPASGYHPHLMFTLDAGLTQRLLGVVDARAAVPALRVEPAVRGGVAPEFTGQCVPRVVRVDFVDQDGVPALRVVFDLRDGRWRDRVADGDEQPLAGSIVATAPLSLQAGARPQLAVDFALSQVELPELPDVSPSRRPEVAAALAQALSATLRVDVGMVSLLEFVAADALGIRALRLQPGSDGSVVAAFVTNLRPVGAPPEPPDRGAAVTMHAGLLEAWLRRQSVTSAIRRTLTADGQLDPNGLYATTLDGVQWSADRAVLRVTRWCLDDVGCGREPVEVAVEMVPGGAAVAAAQTGAVPIDGWVEGVASQTTRLWSGFGLALGDGSLLWPTAVTMRSAPPGGTALVGGWSERSATR